MAKKKTYIPKMSAAKPIKSSTIAAPRVVRSSAPEMLLAQLLSRPLIAPKPASVDLARYIVMNANAKWEASVGQNTTAPKKTSHGPSLLSRVIDVLSRPNFAVAEGVRNLNESIATKDENPIGAILGGLGQGITGKKKTTFSDVIQEAEQMDVAEDKFGDRSRFKDVSADVNRVAKHGLGFVADVFLDPTTYLGVGAVKSLAKLAKPAEKTVTDTFDLEQSLTKARGDIVSPPPTKELVPPVGKTPNIQIPSNKLSSPVLDVKTPAMPDLSQILGRRVGLQNTNAVLTTQGVQNVKAGKEFYEKMLKGKERKKPEFNITKAEDLVQGMADGNPDAIKLVGPKTPLAAAQAASETERLVANKIAEEYAQTILRNQAKTPKNRTKSAHPNSPSQQANLYSRLLESAGDILTSGAKKADASKMLGAKHVIAHRMLREAEAVLDSKGLTPTFWDGSKVKLSEVIDEIGGPMAVDDEFMPQLVQQFKMSNPNNIKQGKIKQAIENIRARQAAADARAVHFSLDTAAQKAAIADEVLSPAKYKLFEKRIQEDAQAVTRGQDASRAAAEATGSLLRQILRMSTPLPQQAIETYSKQIVQDMSTGKVSKGQAFVVDKVTKAIDQTLGSSIKDVSKSIGDGNRAIEYFGARLATWYGNKDLRPVVLDNFATAKANASKRSEIWRDVEAKHAPEEIDEAFKVATGLATNPTPRVQQLSELFQDSMERLFMTSGLQEEAFNAASVATRSGLLMKDINRQLGRMHAEFRFTNKRVIDLLGNEKDYSEGINWLKSWETAQPKDPIKFMYQMDLAVEQVVKEYATFDEIIARWGSPAKVGEFNKQITHHRFTGSYFTPEIAPQIEKVIKELHSFQRPDSQLIRHYDQILRMWKSGVTKYAPSHHIRNIIGDSFNSWLAGVNSVTPYRKAARVIWSQKNKYEDLEDIENLVGKNAISMAMTKPGDSIVTTKGGIQLTADQIYIAAHNHGLLQTVHVIEDIFGDKPFKFKPLGGKVEHVANVTSEHREHFVRLAHFIDSISKNKSKNLKEVFESASKDVRKWHPDAMDLTDFEKKVMRRLIPFYSWTRKEIPLLVEALVVNPGKILAYPKGMEALQGMLGIETEGRSQPFPTDQLFPQWIRDKGVGPLGKPDQLSSISRQDPPGYSMVNPSNPFMDVGAQFSHPVKGIAEMLTPAFRIPAEVATGQEVLGGPINRDNAAEYATEQIPIAAILQRITNVGLGGTTERGEKEGLGSGQALMNYLTAAGVLGTGPYIKQAGYEQNQQLLKQAKGG